MFEKVAERTLSGSHSKQASMGCIPIDHSLVHWEMAELVPDFVGTGAGTDTEADILRDSEVVVDMDTEIGMVLVMGMDTAIEVDIVA
jgi:hypothetical protein